MGEPNSTRTTPPRSTADAAAPLHERTTIRMRVAPDRTLDGYVFADEDHARQWLSMPALGDLTRVKLERVLVGEFRKCPCCRGNGSTRSVKKVADVSLEEVLGNG